MQPTSRDSKKFEEAMKEMGADPEILAECEAIAHDFAALESDCLSEE
jgi:hypothetical protein